MGDLVWLWENGRPMGICRDVWGDASGVWLYGETAIPYGEMACVGGRGIAWGSRENVWEMSQDMGNGACIWRGRQAVWGAKNHIKTRNIGTVGGLWTCTFSGIFVGTAVLSGRPLKCMGIIKNMAMHEPPDAACGLRIFGNIGGAAWVWEMAQSTEATPESAVAAPLQAIGMFGVPVTALPSGGLHPAGACRRVPPREAAETPPCTALPRRAAGSSTGRRSSPSGRRSWGRDRGRPVCRSSYVRTWGTFLS